MQNVPFSSWRAVMECTLTVLERMLAGSLSLVLVDAIVVEDLGF